MPEIGEVARIVHYIHKHIVGKTITKVTGYHDDIVFGKVGTSAAEFEKQMSGKKVIDAGQQGKYFWMIMSSPPHPLMHFGMSGWFKVKSEHTYYYRQRENEPPQEWPPKYLKFMLELKGEDGGTEEAAFVDGRRLGRIRLIDCDGKEIRKHSPLKENGPDPVIDRDLVSLEWLTEKCRKKKVPIKAMLLDQAVISGIGNWVADEVMYNAKMHPEQYSNTLQDAQIKQLHESIHYVCGLACELLADSEQFPKDWLFKHRWGKGKVKGVKKLPNGNRIDFLTVGGRTSAVVPAVQKKTGPVAGDVDENVLDDSEQDNEDVEEDEEEAEEVKPKKSKKSDSRKRKAGDDEEAKKPVKKSKTNGVPRKEPKQANRAAAKGKEAKSVKKEAAEVPKETPKKTASRGKRASKVMEAVPEKDNKTKASVKGRKATTSKKEEEKPQSESGPRRRSGRLAKSST